MGRPLAVSEARAREDRGPGGPPRPGGFSGRGQAASAVRGLAASAAGGGALAARGLAAAWRRVGGRAPGGLTAPGGAREQDFGPPAPPKGKKKPFKKDENRPRGPDPDEVHRPDVRPRRRRGRRFDRHTPDFMKHEDRSD